MLKKFIASIVALTLMFTLCSCGAKEDTNYNTTTTEAPSNVEVNLKTVYDNCAAEMPEMIALDAEMMLSFCGINESDCKEVYISICADSLRADEIWIIEAKDADALDRISQLATARISAKADESITYSPEQYAIVQKAEVITSGNYFALVVSPDVSTIKTIIDNAY